MNEQMAHHHHPSPLPLFRLWLCGPFQAARCNGTTYDLLPLKAWGGSNDPRRLLKRLLCSPRRQVRRGELLESLWPEIDPDLSRGYLNDAVYRLRAALCPNKEMKSLLITSDDHGSLHVPEQALLWVDADAALSLLTQAEASKQSGDDPFLLVEEAVQYLARGEFLEDEEGIWVHGRRGTLERARHGSLLWLARLYQQRGSLRQAETVLNALLEQDAMDEDALCVLMTNLHLQQRTSEAFRLFEQTARLLHENGLEMGASTKEIRDSIRNQPLSQEHTVVSPALTAVSSFVQPEPSLNPADRVAKYDILIPISPGTTATSLDTANGDCAMWFSEQLAQIIAFVSKWQNQMPARDFEKMLYQELRVFDEVKAMFNPDTYFLSRRSALLVIAALPKGLLGLLQQQKNAFIAEEFLPTCAASITACWYLLNGMEFASVERALSRYIHYLIGWAQQPSPYQRTAAYLASQGCLQLGFIALHHLQFPQRVVYCKEAVKFGKEAGDTTLLVKALTQLGNAYYDQSMYKRMLQSYQEAKSLMQDVPYCLQSKVLMGLAHTHAQQGQAKEALDAINQACMIFPGEIEDVPAFLSADDGLFSLILFEGWVHLDLGKQYPDRAYNRQAAQALAQIESLSAMTLVPERIRIEILNRRAQASIALGNLDAFREYTLQSAESLKHIHSEKRHQELVTNYKTAREKWPHESQVQELADMLL